MIGLFFEVQTKPGHRDQYLDLAASLKPDLEVMGGCVFIDRFRSLTRENMLLSYQIWQDEGTLTAWRAHAYHHDVQTIGREAHDFDRWLTCTVEEAKEMLKVPPVELFAARPVDEVDRPAAAPVTPA